MNFKPGHLYHIYNQGNNRQCIFFNADDYIIFLKMYRKLFIPCAETLAWCLMPNHFHFMLYTDERCFVQIKQGGLVIDPVTNAIRKLLSGYARIFNKRYERTGSVFRQKSKSKCLNDITVEPGKNITIMDYFVNCFHYLHQNPFRAKLVVRLEDWEFSSFNDYAGLRNGTLCNKDLAVKLCGYDPATFMEKSYELVHDEIINKLR
jgi:REP element-mobilizing transposase RayT